MEAKYCLRHPSLAEEVGPYGLTDLRRAIEAGTFPRNSDVCRVGDASYRWEPVTDVLGLPPAAPEAPPPVAPSASVVLPRATASRAQVRSESAYPELRMLVTAALWIGVAAAVIQLIIVLASAGQALTAAPLTLTFLSTFVEILLLLVGAGMLHAVLDLADCALRRDRAAD